MYGTHGVLLYLHMYSLYTVLYRYAAVLYISNLYIS